MDFVAVNMEGAEAAAIEGMPRTLTITRAVCIACHNLSRRGRR